MSTRENIRLIARTPLLIVTERKYTLQLFSGFYGPMTTISRWYLHDLIVCLVTEKTQ